VTQKFHQIDHVFVRNAFVYDPETGSLRWAEGRVRAGKEAGHVHTCTVGKKYVQVRCDRRLAYAHRIIWTMVMGEIPDGMQIDHIDGDGTNNRLANLRLVTDSENKRNQRKMKNNTSGFTGVYLDKRRGTYTARVTIDGRFSTIGRASTAEEANALRQAFNRQNGFHENHGQDRPL